MIAKSKILIDVGSSTIKAYKKDESGSVKLFLTRSILFKEGFSSEKGISKKNKKELFETIKAIKNKNPDTLIKIYATSIFREFSKKAKIDFIDEFFQRTNLFFNIISHDLENFYLEKALTGKCSLEEPVLLMNIGGGSSELVVMYGDEAAERHNIKIGVGAILSEFKGINKPISKIKIEKIVEFVKSKLPQLSNKVKVAFYSGGELNYMKLAEYPLEKNDLFSDKDHPMKISSAKFFAKNKDIFNEIKLEELENLMPDNPKWMHGARACSALAQAICEKYNIETIIPSDSNLIDGVVRQEFRYATLSGSFRKHLDYIIKVKKILEKKGVIILSPRFVEPKNPGEEFVVFSGEEDMTPLELERHHLNSIKKSDVLIVCDPEGYVGNSALIEIGYARALGKRIIFMEKPEEFMLNTLPAEINL